MYDAAGGVGAVTYWAPTTVYLTVTVHGKKVHAGVEPEKGINAMKVAAEAIANMPLGPHRPGDGRQHRHDRKRRGAQHRAGRSADDGHGAQPRPGQARRPDRHDAQAFEDAAKTYGATVDFDVEEMYRTYKIDQPERPYREAERAIESLGIEVIHRKSGGGTDGNVYNAAGIPCVAMCTGMVDEHAATRTHLDRGPGNGREDPGDRRHPGTGGRNPAGRRVVRGPMTDAATTSH